MQMQFGTDHDNRAPRIIDALSKKILAEAALLAFQRIGQRLQRTIVRATQNAAAAAVIEQRVDGFLQHALFISNDDVRRMKFNQLLQAVVAVDDSTIKIV